MSTNLLDDQPQLQSNVQRAGFGIRLGAYLLDYVFVLILSFAIAFLAVFLLVGNDPVFFEGTTEEETLVTQMILTVAVGSTLYTLIEVFKGASSGKMIGSSEIFVET